MLNKLLFTVGLSLAALWTTRAPAAEPAPPAETAVMMSPYEVKANSVEFKGWTKLRSPNFVVYTDARAQEVRPLVRQMEMLHMIAQVMFGRRPLAHEPMTIILPTSRSDWRKLRSKGRVEWKVAVSGFNTYAYGSLVEYDWQRDGIDTLWAGMSSTETRWLGLELPFTLNKGVAFFYETLKVGDGGVRIGRGNPRVAALNHYGWMDWSRLFGVGAGSSEFVKESGDLYRFSGQASLFVHYLLTREDTVSLPQLLQWGALLEAGVAPTSEHFQAVFGLTYDALQARLEKFLNGEEFKVKIFGFPPEALNFVVTEVDVKVQEMRDLFVLVQIINQQVDDSKASLDVLLAKGLTTRALAPLLIEACADWGRPTETLTELRAMLAEGHDAAEAYALAAKLLLEESMKIDDIDSWIAAEPAAQARRWCEAALEREPLLLEANECLTALLVHGETVTPEDVDRVKHRCEVMAGNGRTDVCLAALALGAWRAGDPDRARRICQHVLGSDYAGKRARTLVEGVLARIDGGAPATAPAAGAATAEPAATD